MLTFWVSHKTLHRSNHNGQPHNISDPKLGSSEIFQSERSSHGFQYKAPGVYIDLNVLAYTWICLCMQLAYFTFLTVHKDADSQEDRDVPRWRQRVSLGTTIAIYGNQSYFWWSPRMIFLTIPKDDDQKQRCPKLASAHVLGDTRLQAVDTSLAYISLLRPPSSSFFCSSMKTLQSSFIVMVDDFHYNRLNREFSKIYFSWMYILPLSVGQWVSDS